MRAVRTLGQEKENMHRNVSDLWEAVTQWFLVFSVHLIGNLLKILTPAFYPQRWLKLAYRGTRHLNLMAAQVIQS